MHFLVFSRSFSESEPHLREASGGSLATERMVGLPNEEGRMIGDDAGRMTGEEVTERVERGIGIGMAGECELDPERL